MYRSATAPVRPPRGGTRGKGVHQSCRCRCLLGRAGPSVVDG